MFPKVDTNLTKLNIPRVSSIESKSSHPMAAALVDHAQSHSIEPKPEKVEQFKNYPGEGIYGKIDGKEIYIGNSKISSRAGCPSVPILGGNIDEGKSVGYIFLGSTPAGFFCLADVCRTGAKEALQELKLAGIKTIMLTGDSYAAARHAQDQLGGALEVIHAELLPEDKARIVKDYQKLACTAMIGDGINDAPALATADIGISMGISGSALATETGHVILMTNDIRRIPKVARLARRVRRKILENVILSVATKGSIVALVIAGHPLVWAAVLADVGTCLLVTLNSMLLLREMPKHRRECCKLSAASLVNKHSKKCSGNDLLHTPCCSAKKPQEHCNVKSCSSQNCAPGHQSGQSRTNSRSSGNSNSSDSSDKHSCCGHGDGIQKAKCSNLGSDNSNDEHRRESSTHQHGEINSSKSIKMLGKSVSSAKEDKSSGNDLSCAHQSCYQDMQPQKHCEVETCFSRKCAPTHKSGELSHNSCGSCKSSEPNDKKICCDHGNQARKANSCDPGSCNSNAERIVSNRRHHGESNCSKSSTMHGADHGAHEIKHCHHSITFSNFHSCNSSIQDSQLSQKTEVEGKICPDHPKDHITPDEEIGELIRFCCSHDQDNNVQSLCKIHAAKCCPPFQQTTFDNLGGHNHVGCKARRTCVALEKRHVGGCCESFRKECCVNSGHFGANFRECLSEIVIE